MKNMKYMLIAVVCLVTLLGVTGIGKNSITEVIGASATPTPTPVKNFYATTKPMPEELTYWMLFEQIKALETKDTESFANGETSAFKDSFYRENIGLQPSQFSAVDTVVTNFFSQIQPIDQQAREIINQYRSQYPNGELRKNQTTQSSGKFSSARSQSPIEKLPPPPTQLQQLQNQKNQIILNAKENIKQALGLSEFAEFDAAVKADASKVLVPLNLGSRTPEPFPSPSN